MTFHQTSIISSRRAPALMDRSTAFSNRSVWNLLYAGLALVDLLALVAGPILGTLLLKAAGQARPTLLISFALSPIYAILAFNNGGFSKISLKRKIESVRRVVGAYALAVLLTVLISFALKNAQEISRLAFSVDSATTLILIVTGRILLTRAACRVTGAATINELLILDGRPMPSGHNGGTVLDAETALLRPDLNDPIMLDRFGRLAAQYDRIVVNSLPEHHRQWAMMLKGADVDGEIIHEEARAVGAIGIGAFNGHETLLIARKPMSTANRLKKRALDLAITVPLFILLAPVLIMTAILIKLDSPGPVLFCQARVGRGNQLFTVLKFRSMRAEKCDVQGDRSIGRNDERVTRVGRFIRATSIDELPQLINVLIGEMSLVGPRPHALGSLAGEQLFWQIDERYWHRHQLKPGITGLAQVRGLRGATSCVSDLTGRLGSDLEYINNWDIWRDVAIMCNTFRVLIHPNAY